MNKQVKELLIVMPICLALAGLIAFLCLLDPTFDSDKIIIAIIFSMWAFFIIPSILYTKDWAKIHLNNIDTAHSFRIGLIWGDLIFLALIIFAPISGVLWFIKTIRN